MAANDDLVVQFEPSDEAEWRCAYEVRGVRYFVYYRDGVSWVAYPSGAKTWLPESFSVEAEPVDSAVLAYGAAMKFVIVKGRPVCVELALRREGLDISSEGLRKVSVSRLLREAALAAAHESPDPARWSPRALGAGRWARLYASENQQRRSPGRRLGDEHYKRVAEIYEEARVAGADPVEAVKSHEHCSRSTAGRWVGEARRRGFLAKTTPGKPSEAMSRKGRTNTKER